MTTFFLGCFAFGLLFTVASFLLGAFGGHLHLGSVDVHDAHGGGGHGDHAVSPFNLSTVSAFLAWFGGAGYLLSRFSTLGALVVFTLAGVAGIVGGGIVFVTLTKYVLPRLTPMRPEDHRTEGALARVTSAIRPGLLGEVVYTVGGTQKVDPARAAAADAQLEQGTEVVIMRREKGVAIVERLEQAIGGPPVLPGPPGD